MHTVKVLGSGCANCDRLAALTDQALSQLDRPEQVEKITDYAAIAALGVMATCGVRKVGSGGEAVFVEESAESVSALDEGRSTNA